MTSDYIFYLQYCRELRNILSSTQISLREGQLSHKGNVTASMLYDSNLARSILKNREGYKFLKTIRGSAPYWECTTKDLFSMVLQLGILTWFCSFSAADRRWPEIVAATLRQQNKEVPHNIS